MQSTKKIDLLSFGNTIVDMEYKVADDQLRNLGIEKGSMTLIDKIKRDELHQSLGDNVHLCSGGSAANSLFVAKQLGLNVHHFGVIGTDSLSRFVLEDYNASGIHQSFNQTQKEGDTGSCLVLITPDGERTMLTTLGVSNQFKSTDAIHPLISNAHQLFIEGYLVSDDRCYERITTDIIPFAKSNQTQLVFTLSDAGLISFFKERFSTLIQLGLDIVFCNFQEARTLSDATSIDDMATFFSPLTKETIVTDGQNGAHVITNDAVIHCPTQEIDPVDTTGAGDAFAGTYLAQRRQSIGIDAAGKKANDISTLVISHFGARPLALTHELPSL